MAPIYHLAPAARWAAWPQHVPYLPAEYDADGFVHCTAGAELMIAIANRFYRSAPGAFVVLEIAPERLTAPLRWEAPADEDPLAPIFPHIYGPIAHAAVVSAHRLRRDDDGTFLGW
jgi:uncharacterized protein (DUF952 family)